MRSVVGVLAAGTVIGLAGAGLLAPAANGASLDVKATTPRAALDRPKIVSDPIPYGAKRKRQMAGYSWRHYHSRTWKLTQVRQIVLHYTTTSTYQPIHNFFAGNAPGLGPSGTKPERPGNCTHFVVDKDGTIYQLAPLSIMCRQAIGLNHRSVGIEFIEKRSAGNILRRPKQVRAGLALVAWLQGTYSIANSDVIGHSMVNRSRYFLDYAGWKNDHTDWRRGEVRTFRKLLPASREL